MKKLLIKTGLALVLAFVILLTLSFLSTIPSLTSFVDMITNSVSYQTIGQAESLGLLENAKINNTKKKLLLGDSVAYQLYAYRTNEEYCCLPGNMAMSMAWQYICIRDYLKANPQTTDVYLCITPDFLERSFEVGLSYSYLMVPLAKTSNMDVLGVEQKKLLEEMYGSFFVKSDVAEYIGSSGFNTKLYLNGIKKYYEFFPGKKAAVEKTENPDMTLAETYILKMHQLCTEKNVTLHVLPNPKKDIPESREYVNQLEQKYKNSELYQLYPDYFEQIVFYPEELFKDELHFTDEFMENTGKFEVIKDVQKATGELEGLLE